jgi:Pectate lyase superfamily protein
MTEPFNLAAAASKSLNSPASRVLADRLSDVINVKDYGARGDGRVDDGRAIQAAFDMAFGPANNPHGIANAHLNRPVFFPPGLYRVSRTLMLTQVYGGYIFGAPNALIRGPSAQVGPLIKVNGMVNSRVERLSLNASNRTGYVCFDLDWDGTGPVGLHDNYISVIVGYCEIGVRVAHSGNDGARNFFSSGGASMKGYMMQIEGANATDNVCFTCGASSSGGVIHVQRGHVAAIIGGSYAAGGGFDIWLENTTGHTFIAGFRSESPQFLKIAGDATVVGVHQTGNGQLPPNNSVLDFCAMTGNGHVIVEGCASGSAYGITGTGHLYKRLSGAKSNLFAGTIMQDVS